jgi:hypothetical protein
MKILVTRSCTARLFMKNLERIHDDFPGSEISVLVQKSLKDEVLQNPLVDEVIEYQGREPRFGIFNSRFSFILNLRKRNFDLLIILYNDINGVSYGNVRNLALAIASARIKAYNSCGEVFSFKEIYSKKLILDFLLGIFDHKIMVKLVLIFNALYKSLLLTRERVQGFFKSKAGSH